MGGKSRISLVMTTRNRGVQLATTLERLDDEDVLRSDTEVIVVDNGSTDDTPALLRQFQKSTSVPFIVVHEARRGSGNAKNAGIRASSGEYLVFTDDDCYLGEGYLSVCRDVFTRMSPDYGGGRTLLFDASDARETVNYHDRPRTFSPNTIMHPGFIIGTNMFFHRSIVEKVGFFDPAFGSGTAFPCDDLEYISRCSLAGFYGSYLPECVVYHHHGRKAGSREMTARMHQYYHAIGAYYMRALFESRWNFLRDYLANFRADRSMFSRSLAGAAHYAMLRMLKWTGP